MLRIGVLALVTSGPAHGLYSKLMNANLASIMPQVIGAWCEEAGHEVRFVCYTGYEDLSQELPADTDLLFISSFTEAAQLSYAISSMSRQRGTTTAIAAHHARSYPKDSARYFDYVFASTKK